MPAEPGYVRDRLRPGDDGEQAQQQNLIERIFDLAALPNVRHISEIPREDDCFAKRPDFLDRTLHRNPPIGESVDSDRFSTQPICPELLRPIALMCACVHVDGLALRGVEYSPRAVWAMSLDHREACPAPAHT